MRKFIYINNIIMSEKINNKRIRIFNIVDKYESDLPELIYADIINDLVNAKNNKDLDEILFT